MTTYEDTFKVLSTVFHILPYSMCPRYNSYPSAIESNKDELFVPFFI